jgi:acetylornithine/N-succinyldiaminopimelate aminotransferase
MIKLRQWFYDHIAQTSDMSMGLEIESGIGVFLYDNKGKAYLDFISGICVSNLGHGDTDIIQAIWHQTRKYLHPIVYGEGVMNPQVMYAHALAEELDDHLTNVYFTNSGAEAVEGALKVAKKYTGKEELIAFHHAYHGSTHGALSVSGDPDAKVGYGPMLPNIKHIRYNHLEDLQYITEDTAAVIIEPIQGAGGVILPRPGYLETVRERCDTTNTLLIMDEIQTGFGRTGSLFAHQKYNVIPDILILAKALGGGMPLGAFITSQEIMSVIRHNPPLGHITTFGGHPVCCAAGIALFNKLRNTRILDTIPEKEQLLRQHLVHPAIQELRGTGLLFALILSSHEDTLKVQKAALEKGLITIGFLSEPRGLRIAPPLTITHEELLYGINILLEVLDEVI